MTQAEIRVLGPLEVVGDHGQVALAAKQRLLLAALVIADTRTCGVDTLVEAIWDGAVPPSANKLVQVYVSQIRRCSRQAFGSRRARADTRSSFPPSCSTRSASSACSKRVLRLVARETTSSRHRSRHRGCSSGAARRTATSRMQTSSGRNPSGSRSFVAERWTSGSPRDLALGRHEEVLGEVLALAAENPLRERTHEHAMLALYRCGRQSDALEHFAAFRRRLRDDLGLEPGAPLRDLQARILRQEPSLDAPRGADDALLALPQPLTRLVGRERELEELRRDRPP